MTEFQKLIAGSGDKINIFTFRKAVKRHGLTKFQNLYLALKAKMLMAKIQMVNLYRRELSFDEKEMLINMAGKYYSSILFTHTLYYFISQSSKNPEKFSWRDLEILSLILPSDHAIEFSIINPLVVGNQLSPIKGTTKYLYDRIQVNGRNPLKTFGSDRFEKLRSHLTKVKRALEKDANSYQNLDTEFKELLGEIDDTLNPDQEEILSAKNATAKLIERANLLDLVQLFPSYETKYASELTANQFSDDLTEFNKLTQLTVTRETFLALWSINRYKKDLAPVYISNSRGCCNNSLSFELPESRNLYKTDYYKELERTDFLGTIYPEITQRAFEIVQKYPIGYFRAGNAPQAEITLTEAIDRATPQYINDLRSIYTFSKMSEAWKEIMFDGRSLNPEDLSNPAYVDTVISTFEPKLAMIEENNNLLMHTDYFHRSILAYDEFSPEYFAFQLALKAFEYKKKGLKDEFVLFYKGNNKFDKSYSRKLDLELDRLFNRYKLTYVENVAQEIYEKTKNFFSKSTITAIKKSKKLKWIKTHLKETQILQAEHVLNKVKRDKKETHIHYLRDVTSKPIPGENFNPDFVPEHARLEVRSHGELLGIIIKQLASSFKSTFAHEFTRDSPSTLVVREFFEKLRERYERYVKQKYERETKADIKNYDSFYVRKLSKDLGKLLWKAVFRTAREMQQKYPFSDELYGRYLHLDSDYYAQAYDSKDGYTSLTKDFLEYDKAREQKGIEASKRIRNSISTLSPNKKETYKPIELKFPEEAKDLSNEDKEAVFNYVNSLNDKSNADLTDKERAQLKKIDSWKRSPKKSRVSERYLETKRDNTNISRNRFKGLKQFQKIKESPKMSDIDLKEILKDAKNKKREIKDYRETREVVRDNTAIRTPKFTEQEIIFSDKKIEVPEEDLQDILQSSRELAAMKAEDQAEAKMSLEQKLHKWIGYDETRIPAQEFDLKSILTKSPNFDKLSTEELPSPDDQKSRALFQLLRMLGLSEKDLISDNVPEDIYYKKKSYVQYFQAQNIKRIAYKTEPFLSTEHLEIKTSSTYNPYGMGSNTQTTKIITPVSQKIFNEAYNKKTGKINLSHIDVVFKELQKQSQGTLVSSKDGTPTIKRFCEANYKDWENDDDFQFLFDNTDHLRGEIVAKASQLGYKFDLDKINKKLTKKIRPGVYWIRHVVEPAFGYIIGVILALVVIYFVIGFIPFAPALGAFLGNIGSLITGAIARTAIVKSTVAFFSAISLKQAGVIIFLALDVVWVPMGFIMARHYMVNVYPSIEFQKNYVSAINFLDARHLQQPTYKLADYESLKKKTKEYKFEVIMYTAGLVALDLPFAAIAVKTAYKGMRIAHRRLLKEAIPKILLDEGLQEAGHSSGKLISKSQFYGERSKFINWVGKNIDWKTAEFIQGLKPLQTMRMGDEVKHLLPKMKIYEIIKKSENSRESLTNLLLQINQRLTYKEMQKLKGVLKASKKLKPNWRYNILTKIKKIFSGKRDIRANLTKVREVTGKSLFSSLKAYLTSMYQLRLYRKNVMKAIRKSDSLYDNLLNSSDQYDEVVKNIETYLENLKNLALEVPDSRTHRVLNRNARVLPEI